MSLIWSEYYFNILYNCYLISIIQLKYILQQKWIIIASVLVKTITKNKYKYT